ncbi:Ig-like domain-containing protein [Sphaerisporangium sp. NPDC005288]|uniref:Ig-like domain-containing protein n=1 Tax=Sphaerisporangium sp. NPDC005288 TaxID=3155114 RepID=UPI0033BDA1E4
MGALAAAPSSASASTAPQALGTQAASLLPAGPVKPGFSVTVRRATATTTTLTSSHNPSRRGESVTFTASVTATGTTILPTGRVVFKNGTVELGTADLLTGGRATLTTTTLAEGTHTISAQYLGNTAFDPSPIATLVQRVEADRKDDGKKDDGKKEAQKSDHDDDWEDEDEPRTTRHDDDDEHQCRRLRNAEERHGISAHHTKEEWENLRRRCDRWWHDRNDHTVLVDRGIRRHIEGWFDHGGGHREYWDNHRHKWVPEHHEHHEKRYHQKHYKKERPRPVQHFAVTG